MEAERFTFTRRANTFLHYSLVFSWLGIQARCDVHRGLLAWIAYVSLVDDAKLRDNIRSLQKTVMIKRLEFSIDIEAETSTIWKALWDETAYREWAGVFFEGSFVVAEDWTAGSRVHFLGPDQNGIYSFIEKHLPNQIMQFRHIGTVVDGVEQPVDDETAKWSGTRETYTLLKGKTANTLMVEIDVMNEHLEFMTEKFPEALRKIKENCG